MTRTILIAVLIGVVAFEVIEHVIAPLAFALLGRRRRSVSGAEGMVGKVVEVRRWEGREGTVSCAGELWAATGPHPLATGDRAVVEQVDGLRLRIRAAAEPDRGDHRRLPGPPSRFA